MTKHLKMTCLEIPKISKLSKTKLYDKLDILLLINETIFF